MPDKKQWIVITNGEHPLDDVSAALEKKGFSVHSKLDAIGQIIGSGSEAARKEALKVKGVTDIQPSFDVNVGPPGNDLTW